MSTTENSSRKIKKERLPEVDQLLSQAGQLAPEAVDFEQAENVPDRSHAVKKRRMRKKSPRRGLVVAVLCLLVAVIAGSVVIAEPWVPAVQDNYVEPVVKQLADRTLAVNENYAFEISLSENEKISQVEVQDPDILALSEDLGSVTAKGEYFRTTVSITTSEIEVPEREFAHKISLFGKDFSEPYDKLRSFLRDLFGVEERTDPRTELRVLGRYTQTFTVDGIEGVTTTPPAELAACLQNGITLETPLSEGEELQLISYNTATAAVSLNKLENGVATFTVKGAAVASTKIEALVGFWKEVTPEIYAEYLASGAAQAVPGIPEKRENHIFVPQRAALFNVSVKDLSQPVVTTNLEEEIDPQTPEDGLREDVARELLDLINNLRTANNLPALSWNDAFAEGAAVRAQELTSVYSYVRPDGSAGISAASGAVQESISAGYLTAQEILDCWNSCDSLRACMLSPDYTTFGAACLRKTDGVYNNYWCGLYA